MGENKSREVYDPEEKIIDFRRLKPTDMSNNPRVGLPKARPPGEEKLIAAREVLRDQVFHKFKTQECNEEGFQKENNLTREQMEGKKSLEERAKSGELIFTQTDKSGKNCIISSEVYKKMGDSHASKDQRVTWKEVEESRNEIKGHALAMANCFQMGQDWGDSSEHRVRTTVNQSVTAIAQMSVTPKDHKPVQDDGTPK